MQMITKTFICVVTEIYYFGSQYYGKKGRNKRREQKVIWGIWDEKSL